MACGLKLLLSSVAVIHLVEAASNGSINKFPDGFLLGATTASYQIEGAWNEDGKGENIWDHMLHEHPEYVVDGANGDVACDSYHKYAEDVEALKGIGANAYSFSISWSRILPTGDVDVINQAGIDYYNNLINLLLENGIEPLVVMYHYDLPQPLQYLGGWPNPILADYFVEYARILFQNFGDRVKWWITFKEPLTFVSGYSSVGGQAPGIPSPGIGDYMAAHTVVRSHGKVYRLYDQEFRATQNGKVGIALNCYWFEPQEDSEEYLEAQRRMFEFQLGLYAHPIFVDGDYPPVVRQRVDSNSAAEGRPRSRLPSFTEEEKQQIKGSADFFGLNQYTSNLVVPGIGGESPSMGYDTGAYGIFDPSWPESAASWIRVVPWGLRKMLNWLATEYPGYPIIVTENGFADTGELDDQGRINYYGVIRNMEGRACPGLSYLKKEQLNYELAVRRMTCDGSVGELAARLRKALDQTIVISEETVGEGYLAEMLKAINEDGVNVIGYTLWSLIDNLEWNQGFSQKYGLYKVDFNSPERTRTPKASAAFIGGIYRNRTVPEEYFQ